MTANPCLVVADFDRKRLDRHRHTLTAGGYEVTGALSGSTAFDHARRTGARVVVAEAMLPDLNGFDLATKLRGDERTANARIILVLDENDSYGAARAAGAPVDAVIRRPFTDEDLLARVRAVESAAILRGATTAPTTAGEIAPLLDAMEARVREENPILPHLTDPVTGLWNAGYTALKLADEYKKARRFNTPLSCVALALDDFPARGPDDPAARQILTEVAGLLLCESRDIDHLGRADAESFLLVLAHTDLPGARTMAARVVSSIEKRSLMAAGRNRPLTASAGVAAFHADDAQSSDELVTRAKEALKAARRDGGNRVQLFEREPSRS